VKAVGEDGHRPREIPEGNLRARDDEVEDENAAENADDGMVAVCHLEIQNSKCKMQTLPPTQERGECRRDSHPDAANRFLFALCILNFELLPRFRKHAR
jgi:hypothetical protein